MTLYRPIAAAILIISMALLGCGCMVAAHAAPAAAVVAAAPAAAWWTSPTTIIDIVKAAIPLLVGIAAWAWRVESRLGKHDAALDTLTTTLTKIEKTLTDWAEVKEDRAERLARLEAKIDLIIADRQR